MVIKKSPNIDAPGCTACARRRPWKSTLAALAAKLQAHNVTWPDFVVMHGKGMTCAEALASSGVQDRGLYVVAVDAAGRQARHARVFARKDPHYVGVRAILEDKAF